MTASGIWTKSSGCVQPLYNKTIAERVVSRLKPSLHCTSAVLSYLSKAPRRALVHEESKLRSWGSNGR